MQIVRSELTNDNSMTSYKQRPISYASAVVWYNYTARVLHSILTLTNCYNQACRSQAGQEVRRRSFQLATSHWRIRAKVWGAHGEPVARTHNGSLA